MNNNRPIARRRFVKVVGGGLVAAGLSSALAACSKVTATSSAEAVPTATTGANAASSSPVATATMPPMAGMDMSGTPMPMPSTTALPPTAAAPPTTAPAAAPPTTAPAAAPPTASINTLALTGTLFVPPLLAPQMQNGTKVFNLTAQKGQSQFRAGTTTATFGFNGNYLGPTLRASQDDKVLINVTNQLGETTTVHWHGLHVAAAMDGGPHQMINANTTWNPNFTVQQPAATLWYHPHMMGQTQRQVTMGLVGMFILDDASPVQASLPNTYGVDDIPLIFQDANFGANGQFVGNGNGGGGRGGGGGQAVTLVNGTIAPSFTTSQARLRFRLLNASNQRFYNFGFAGNETFYQIASDGGLLAAPVALTRLRLGPAERVEIVVDVNPAQPLVLQTFGGNAGGGGRGGGGNNGPTGTVLTINPSGTNAKTGALPPQLAAIVKLQAAAATQTRDMVLGGNDQNPTINGQAMRSMDAMMNMANAFQVKLGAVEVWNIINRSGDTHAFHVHDIQFQILDRNGATPAVNEAGFKDTVVINPRETVRIIMHFTDFADPNTPYMYHCHVLLHEDNGMMGQFVVVPA